MSKILTPLEFEESSSNLSHLKTGYFVTKKIAILIAFVVAILFTGSILATYYGKSCNANKNAENINEMTTNKITEMITKTTTETIAVSTQTTQTTQITQFTTDSTTTQSEVKSNL